MHTRKDLSQMKNAPNSKVNLDKAILRFAGDIAWANELIDKVDQA